MEQTSTAVRPRPGQCIYGSGLGQIAFGPGRFPGVLLYHPDGRFLVAGSRPGGPVDSVYAFWNRADARAFLTAAGKGGRLTPSAVTWGEFVFCCRGALAQGLTYLTILCPDGDETEVRGLRLADIVARDDA